MVPKILALLVRALRVEDRLLRMHLLRVAIVLVVAFALWIVHLQSLLFGAPGLSFLTSIAWTAFVIVTLAGATYFPTAITEEKEEQTLPLLTLADVRPLSLIVGKFLPRALTALVVLSVVFPFTLLAITLGGVTWNQVWATYWTLAAHLLFVGAVGLFWSVVCRSSGWACGASLLSILVWLWLALLIEAACDALLALGISPGLAADGADLALSFVELSTAHRLVQILSTGFGESAFGAQVIGNAAAAGVLFLLAWGLFGLFNRNLDGSHPSAVSLLDRRLRLGRKSRRAWQWAIVWKDFHQLTGGTAAWLLRGALFSMIALLLGVMANDFQFSGSLFGRLAESMLGVGILMLALEATVSAARVFRVELKDQTWSSLTALPLSVGQIAWAKIGGCLLGLVPAAALVVGGAMLKSPSTGSVGQSLMILVMAGGYLMGFLLFLHLTVLFSILVNAWAGVLLAAVTSYFANCVIGIPLVFMSFLFASSGGWGSETIAIIAAVVIYIGAFGAILCGLQMMIGQQLRAAAGK